MDLTIKPALMRFTGLPMLAAALMLSTTSHAASNAVVECDQVGRDLQSLEVSVHEIAVDSVDHTPLDADIVDENPEASEPFAPVLNLGPRLSNIMRDVFEVADEQSTGDTSGQSSSSPLADSDDQKTDSEAEDTNNNSSELPRFQRMMRRTDI